MGDTRTEFYVLWPIQHSQDILYQMHSTYINVCILYRKNLVCATTNPIPRESTYHIISLQKLRGHGIAQPHLAIERVLLIVADKLHQALKVGRGPQHKVPAIPVDATVFHLAPGP